ncbi:MAG: EF-hand domain-containing protein [Thiomargarita sp.]|nr:EF-hand domain-containing protein [Thiomargarita sp.]
MKTIIVLSSAVALSLAANITVAQPGFGKNATDSDRTQMRQERVQNRLDRLMERFDIDQDGNITLDEVQTVRTDHFTQMDVDKNGLVSVEELDNFKAKMMEQYRNNNPQANGKRAGNRDCSKRGNQIERLDNNEDGQISLEEFTANVPLFDRFDTDEDGILTQEELSQTQNRGRGRR